MKIQLRKSVLESEKQPALHQLPGALLCWQPSIQYACCWTDLTHVACACDLTDSQSPYSLRSYSKRSYQLTVCGCGTAWSLRLTQVAKRPSEMGRIKHNLFITGSVTFIIHSFRLFCVISKHLHILRCIFFFLFGT